MKINKKLLLTCALAITNNLFSMEESNQQSQDLNVTLLTENNKLLRDIKRQNRFIKKQNHTIIKQNYLSYKYVTQLVQNNSNYNHYSEKQYDLGNEIEKTYMAQSRANNLESCSSEDSK